MDALRQSRHRTEAIGGVYGPPELGRDLPVDEVTEPGLLLELRPILFLLEVERVVAPSHSRTR